MAVLIYAEGLAPTMFSLLLFYASVFRSFVGFIVPAMPTTSTSSLAWLLTNWHPKPGGLELLPVMFSSDFGTSKEFLCEVQFPPTLGWGPVFLVPLCGIAVYWPEIAGDMSGICFRY